ncbi:MAG: ABC transporter substrate-binding protein [Lachnospiraceae bacterium]|nr:ABC transporter substrate-binding protein [Lachnospiraceae bacterium]
MKKKILALILAAVCAISLGACGSSKSTSSSDASTAAGGDTITVGISQFAQHGSLDDCREGFVDGLKSAGYVEGKNLKIDLQNANADTSTAATIADNFVQKKYNLICAIATPAAMSAYNSTKTGDIPVIYTAVSDPVAAELAKDDGSSVGNITGTSDALPVEEQLKMIRAFLPDAKKIGILHTSSETNSDSTIAIYKKLAPKYNFEIVDSPISQLSDVPMAATNLASKVDCISNLTDNTVVQALSAELDAANKAGIPVFGSEIDQVKAGCVGCEGLDYYKLGQQTGAMAAKVLKGEAKASDLKFETITAPSVFINTAVAKKLNITVPDEYLNDSSAQVFDSISKSTQK